MSTPMNKPALGHDVFRWPEYIALAKRLGIADDRLTKSIVIRFAVREIVSVVHEYHGEDGERPHTPAAT